MDVLTEFAAALRPKGEQECHVRLLEHLGARRQKQAAKLNTQVKRLRPDFRKELDHTSTRIIKLLREKGPGASDSVVANATATAVSFAAQRAPPRLNRTNLHPYRLKVKELQNILLMANAPSGRGVGAGLFINGRFHHGPEWTAAEIGYLLVPGAARQPIRRSQSGSLEAAIGIAEIESQLRSPGALCARDIMERAASGDAAARRIVHKSAKILAESAPI